jgi:putative nucleotide binding protein
MLLMKKYEDRGIVLDFLPQGKADDPRPIHLREQLAQVLGDTFFTLLEVVPKEGVTLVPHERVAIGKEQRDKVDRVKHRVSYTELSAAAKAELPSAVEKLISENPDRFLDFFNKAPPITTRFHQLELLPGIGKKLMWAIIEERKKGPFKSFQDLEKRVKGLSDAKKMIAKRVAMELEGVDKYRAFVRPPSRHSGDFE